MKFSDILFDSAPEKPRKKSQLLDLLTDPEPELSEDPIRKPKRIRPDFEENSVFWAMTRIPLSDACKHFLVCGSVGAGKTTIIDLLTQSIAPRFKNSRSQPEQLIIFDSKGDSIPKLAAHGLKIDDPENNVWLLNPYDKRSAKWSLADAAKSPLMARHFASLLIPEEPHSHSPYFWKSSRLVVRAVMTALNGINPEWELSDLIEALSSYDRIRAIVFRNPRAWRTAGAILDDKQHVHAVISSIASRIEAFEDVAALWQRSPSGKVFSIEDFLKKPGVLIIGYDEVLKESFWPINALLLKALSKEILRGAETHLPRHWFVFDEFPALGAIDTIQDLVNRGRSKGASVLVGFQSVDQLYQIYTPSGANNLLEQFAFKTFCRVGGPNTAEWAERYFGKYRRTEPVLTQNFGPVYTYSIQHGIAERSIFLASYFMGLPATGPGKPLVTVNDVPSEGSAVIATRSFDEVASWKNKTDFEAHPPLLPRDEEKDQELELWDEVLVSLYCGSNFCELRKETDERESGREKGSNRGDESTEDFDMPSRSNYQT